MRLTKLVVLALLVSILGCTGCGRKTKLSGAGATFPQVLYQQWAKDFTKQKGIVVEYQGLGSGKGESMISEGTVDFAGSDAPNPKKLQEKVDKGLVFLPMTAGAIVLSYNLEGVKNLKLSQEAVVGIFLGKITEWSDPAIAKDNPDAKLPKEKITVVTRVDKSGTSEIFTGFLSAISSDFEKKIGKTKEPSWPMKVITGDGNPNVMKQIQQNPNSIGYVEYGYGKDHPIAWLQNKDGEFVEPTIKSFQEALKYIELGDSNVGFTFNPKGKTSYPIVTYTWMMLYKKYGDSKKADAVKDFVRYCLHDGQKQAEGLGYIPLPEAIVTRNEKALEQVGS